MHDSKFLKHPRNLRMHWLGPYKKRTLTNVGVVQLKALNGESWEGYENKSH